MVYLIFSIVAVSLISKIINLQRQLYSETSSLKLKIKDLKKENNILNKKLNEINIDINVEV